MMTAMTQVPVPMTTPKKGWHREDAGPSFIVDSHIAIGDWNYCLMRFTVPKLFVPEALMVTLLSPVISR